MPITPVFCCGFECGADGVHWTLSGTSSFTTSSPLNGTRSLRINPTASTGSVTSINAYGAGIHVLRLRVKFTTLPNADTFIAGWSSGNAGAFFKLSDSKLYAGTATGTLGATGVSVTTGTIYVIDIKIDSSTNPWLIDVQVNTSACGQRSTVASADTAAKNYRIMGAVSLTMDAVFDDFLASNTSVDYPVGDGYVNHFVPTADGTHNVAGAADFKRGAAGTDILNSTTDSYLLVDDIPMDLVGAAPTSNDYINAIAPPNATDYTENIFGPAPGISTPTIAPRAVEVAVETAQAATQTGSFKLDLNDNGTVNTIKEQVGIAGITTVAARTKQYAIPPTGGTWIVGGGGNGDFNDLRIRFYSADAAPDQYFVAAMIEAEFAPVSGETITLDKWMLPTNQPIREKNGVVSY